MALCFLITATPVSAGQVVTDEVKLWAKQAIEQEKTLSSAPAPNTLAVLYFNNTTDSAQLDPLQKGLAFMLMTDLSKVDQIELVERVKLQALVDELDLGISGLVETKTAPRVGRLLQATYVVGGDLLKEATAELKIDSDMLKVPDESIIGQPSTEGMLEQIFALEKQLLFQIIEILKVQPTPEEKIELEKPLTTDIDALFYLFRAIDSSDRGNYRKAEILYKKALGQDPGLNSAQEALDELARLNLVTPRDRSKALLENIQDSTSNTSSLTTRDTDLRSSDPDIIIRRTGQIHVQW
ncbi:MAG: CsgG/HfaB family protein [Desulfomonilia bacterium]